jgi:AhpC/TSA family
LPVTIPQLQPDLIFACVAVWRKGANWVIRERDDAASYPEDSFENMKRFAKAHDFPFPYLHDETQTVARAYGAACTPDFFGYNADRKLKYRGRLDEGRTTPPRAGAPRELVEAMRAIASTGLAPADQKASIGCSIKWKDA